MSMIQFRCQHCGVKLETADSDIGKQASCPACGKVLQFELNSMDIESKSSTYEPDECGCAIFIGLLATVELIIGGTMLFCAAISHDPPIFFAVTGGSIAFSSIFTFILQWYIQQIYVSNELKRRQLAVQQEIKEGLADLARAIAEK